MASIALRHKSYSSILKTNQTLLISSRFYSSSSNNDNDGSSPEKTSNFSSYFTNNKPRFNQSSTASGASSFDEIRKNLSEFRRLTSETPLPSNLNLNLNPQMPNSFRNINNKNAANPNPSFSKGGIVSFEKIRENLQKMRDNRVNNNKNVNAQFSLNNYKESFRMRPSMEKSGNNFNNESNIKSRVIGGSIGSLPIATFGKEMKEKVGDDNESKFDLIRMYSHAELGKKLKELRPKTPTLGKKEWFSLSELQQRLGKLKEIEEKDSSAQVGGVPYGEFRSIFKTMVFEKDKKQQKVQKLDILSSASATPKEHLIEKYFHPDNMSSAEKLKIELKKVRDEFKMSESDCGSTRVQIAQLTTEIHHLSSVLHKKDKHSRKGLQAKVQQRKKLLKYLRRTDWDSYTLVLSKLGLRDNPDYKN
ncbi:hypothetical protein RND81_11G136500 [Saponaria officinalis]|uniref:Small ribosomal subunit protein uS15c n=1 Tax=Saponaria officinalis TaxID=3572 RepID=A0AAW1HKQ7_SAPOF